MRPQRTTLPFLTRLCFYGASKYLEEFVARVDLPALCMANIRLFNQVFFFEIPKFCQFVPRLNALGLPTWVSVTHSAEFCRCLIRQRVRIARERELCFGNLMRWLDRQLSFMAQISSRFFPLLSSVHSPTYHPGERGYGLPTQDEDTCWSSLIT